MRFVVDRIVVMRRIPVMWKNVVQLYWPQKHTHTQNMSHLLVFLSINGHVNPPECYDTHTLRVTLKLHAPCMMQNTQFIRQVSHTLKCSHKRHCRNMQETIRGLSGKYSAILEYIDNRSRRLDVTWQPVRGDLTAYPCTFAVTWGQSVGSETPLTQLVYCVTVAFTNLLTFDGDFSFGKSQKSQGAKSGLQGG